MSVIYLATFTTLISKPNTFGTLHNTLVPSTTWSTCSRSLWSLYPAQHLIFRVPLHTLLKCEVALEKMFDTDSSSSFKNPASLPPSTSTQPIHNEPVVPEPKFSTPPQSQSLLDFKIIHSPPATCTNLMEMVQSHLLPDERLPPAKRICTTGIIQCHYLFSGFAETRKCWLDCIYSVNNTKFD